MKNVFMLVLAIIIGRQSYGQVQTSLKVIEANDRSAMIGAHVCLIDTSGKKSYYATDMDGNVRVPYQKNLLATISYAGYKTIEVLLNGGDQTVKIKADLLMLDQVVMTASVETQRVDESIYNVGVINAKTLEKQGAQNVRDALRFQSNINLLEDGVLGSQIVMQGLDGQNVKILVDGVPVIGRQDGNIDLSQIDMTQVDHIEIIEGPMSVVYGSNALAGTINIITKENKYYTLNASALAYAESIGQLNGSGNVSGIVGKHKYGVGGGYRFFNGHDQNEEDRNMNWNPKNQRNVDAYYGYKNKGWDSKFGLRLGHELLTIKGDMISAVNAFDSEYKTNRSTFYGQASKRLSEKSLIKSMLSYSIYDRSAQQYFLNLATGDRNETNEQSEDLFTAWNGRVSYAKSFSERLKWQVGYELTQESGEGVKMEENNGLTENALWSDLKIGITEQLSIQPGVRLVHHNVYGAPLIYSAHLKWNQNSWGAKMSFARGFRAPSMKELYMDFVDTNHQIFGNTDLTPETSYNVSVAVSNYIEMDEQSILKLELSSFYNHLFEVIQLVQGTDGVSYFYQNISEKKTQGGTANVSYNWNNRIQSSVGFTLTGIGYDPFETGDYDFQYAKDVVANISYYLPNIDLSTQLDYKYTGERVQLYATSSDSEIIQGTVAAYDMLNFSMTKGFKNKRYVVTAGAKNLLDITDVNNTTQGGAHSSTSGLMIGWGRSYFLSCKINLKKI
ncbi:MAG: TonB-dependent receptor [Reichenbachiella sp.]